MAGINLLDTNQQGTASINSGMLSKIVARVLMVLVLLAVVIYIIVFLMNYTANRTLVNTQSQIQTLQSQALSNKDRNELVTRQDQLKQLGNLIDNHVYWSYLLPEMARVSLKSAKYSEISAKSNGSMEMVVILPSYADVEKFMQIFDLPEYNQQFSNVRISGIDNTQNGTSIETKLRLELTFNPNYIKGRL